MRVCDGMRVREGKMSIDAPDPDRSISSFTSRLRLIILCETAEAHIYMADD